MKKCLSCFLLFFMLSCHSVFAVQVEQKDTKHNSISKDCQHENISEIAGKSLLNMKRQKGWGENPGSYQVTREREKVFRKDLIKALDKANCLPKKRRDPGL